MKGFVAINVRDSISNFPPYTACAISQALCDPWIMRRICFENQCIDFPTILENRPSSMTYLLSLSHWKHSARTVGEVTQQQSTLRYASKRKAAEIRTSPARYLQIISPYRAPPLPGSHRRTHMEKFPTNCARIFSGASTISRIPTGHITPFTKFVSPSPYRSSRCAKFGHYDPLPTSGICDILRKFLASRLKGSHMRRFRRKALRRCILTHYAI